MKSIVILVIVLLVALIVVLGLLAVVAARWGRRSYQRYSGLERQRASAKQSRETGADRLKDAERQLIDSQRELAARGEHEQARAIEHLRVRLSTMADRHRHATYGYAPLHSPNPVQETELAELQQFDADLIGDAQEIVELAERVRATTRDAVAPDLEPLETALDRLHSTLDRRRAVR